MRPQWSRSSIGSLLEDTQEGTRAEDGHSLVADQLLELRIACHKVIGLAAHRGGQNNVILGMGGHTPDLSGYGSHEGVLTQCRKEPRDLLGAESRTEIRLPQGVLQLTQDVIGDNERELASSPGVQDHPGRTTAAHKA